MLLVDDLAAGGTKNLRHTPRGLVTLGGGGQKLNIFGVRKFCEYLIGIITKLDY